MDFETFGERLDNWARVVRLPKFQSGVCAQWARWYVSIRDSESKYEGAPVSLSRDELDAWIVESAWSGMTKDTYKFVLKYHYIWNMGEQQVITRMRKVHKINLRGRPWDLLVAESEAALKKALVNPENLARMLFRLPIPLRRELTDAPRQAGASEARAELVD